jgi:hypothetical protein
VSNHLPPRTCPCPRQEVFIPEHAGQWHAHGAACRNRKARAEKRNEKLTEAQESDNLLMSEENRIRYGLPRVNLGRTADEILRRSKIAVPIEDVFALDSPENLTRADVAAKRIIIARKILPQLPDNCLLQVLFGDIVDDVEFFSARARVALEVKHNFETVIPVARLMAQVVVRKRGPGPPRLLG